MFGIGLPEMILILGLALIVVGPDKLPGLARSLAKGILELKSTAQTLKDNIASETPALKELQPELEDAAQSIKKQISDSINIDEQEENEDRKELVDDGDREAEEFPTDIYDPLDDEDYDDEDDEDEYVIEGTLNEKVDAEPSSSTVHTDESQGTETDSTPHESEENTENGKTGGRVHNTVKQDLNKENEA